MKIYTNKKQTVFLSVDLGVDGLSEGFQWVPDLYESYGFHFCPNDYNYQEELMTPIKALPYKDNIALIDLLNRKHKKASTNVFSNLSWSDMGSIISFLNKKLDCECWHSWFIGKNNKQSGFYAWIYGKDGLLIDPDSLFNDDRVNDFFGKDWETILFNAFFSSKITIQTCDRNGRLLLSNGPFIIRRRVAGFSLSNINDEIKQYMKMGYNMMPMNKEKKN